MEIRAAGPGQEPAPIAVTMRTPGHDFELATGFLFTEGLIATDDVRRVSYCDGVEPDEALNVVSVQVARPIDLDGVTRNFYSTSSCGVCGKASLDSVEVRCDEVPSGPVVSRTTIEGLPAKMRGDQRIFEKTGGLHAAAGFDESGSLLALREDVGRHNAVDKLVGHALLKKTGTFPGSVLLVSGRASFEIVQKAAVARVPIVCAVSAPSSLAADAADRFGITLVGFLREESFNVYTHPERIRL